MSKINANPPRITCPADLPSLLRALWRNPANSHFLAKMERGHFSNVPVSTIEEAVAEARRLSAAGADVYAAFAGFASHETRTASNTVGSSAFPLDIDCGEAKAAAGKGYATTEIARDELSKSCVKMGIPEPTQVLKSGGGLQVYWVLRKELDPAKWKSIANKLKQILKALGFLADPSRTADIAGVMRLPGTLNYKYDPPRPVTLVESREYVDTDAFCRAVEEAHARLCPAQPVAPQPHAMVAMDRPQGQLDRGTVDLEALRAALATLDPDCDDEIWKLHRIAPAARYGRDHPEYAEPLRNMLMDWSRGDFWHTPSRKWLEPGGNGRTGEQIFPEVWDRFLHEQDRDGPVITLGTIFHDAQLAGAPPVVIPGDALSLLQGRFFLIRQGGSVWVGDREVPGQYLKRSDAGLILDRVLTARCPGVPPAPIIREFFSSPATTEYLGIYSHPTEEREKQLNVWKGWTLRPKSGKCILIMAFLLYVICDGDEEAFRYLLRYLAHLLQRPEEKPGVMIVLLGGQGAGKGTFGHLLHRMLGELYLHVFNLQHVFGNHNDVLERTLLIFADEVSQSQRGKIADAMKSFITEAHVTVNPKNQPVRQIQSFHRLIIASNAEHVKHTDRDDRRDFVLKVSDRHQGDMEYWKALYAEIDGDGTAAFMYELLQLDISDFNVRQRPMTRALMDQKLQSLDDVGRWWHQCLRDGSIEGFDNDWPEFLPTMRALELIEAFAGGRRYRRLTPQDVVKHLLKVCPSVVQDQRRLPSGDRPRGLVLPSLEVARQEFEEYMGGPLQW